MWTDVGVSEEAVGSGNGSNCSNPVRGCGKTGVCSGGISGKGSSPGITMGSWEGEGPLSLLGAE